MRKGFELPDVGEGVAEGELVAWHVDVGEYVEEDQIIAEVETDKALVEIPSAHDGEVVELRAEEGDVVPVGSVLVVFEIGDEDASGGDAIDSTGAARVDAEDNGGVSGESADLPESPVGGGVIVPDERVFAPPSVRRLAREVGVDLGDLQTDGNRITERDVREAARGTGAETESATDDAGRAEPPASESAEFSSEPTEIDSVGEHDSGGRSAEDSERTDRDRTLAMPATRRIARENGIFLDAVPASERRNGEAFVTPDDVRAYAASDGSTSAGGASTVSEMRSDATTTDDPRPGDRIPYTGIRRTIGERMATSKYTAPHVSNHVEVEVSDLVETRTRLKKRAEKQGVKLTYLPFAIKAVVAALQSVPSINAELDEDEEEIVLHDEYNIGIAVASDAGLMVPVIENADEKGLLELAREINDKAERARDRSIRPGEMRGGTFTITNVGAIGGEYASPIINYPEAGILALGSLEERPWAEDGNVVARPTLPISMSVDHRIVDGAEAAQFTNEVERYLTNPELLLLE